MVTFGLVPCVIFSHTPILPIMCALASMIGVYEMLGCLGYSKKLPVLVPSLVVGLYLPICIRYTFSGSPLYMILTILTIYVFYMFSLTVFTNNSISIDDISKTMIMTVYIALGFASIVGLRDVDNGEYIYILAFIGAWITDIFAYFTGMLFGKHKLSPIISPQKTIEGSVGGILLCSLSFLAYSYVLNGAFSLDTNPLSFLIIGIFVSVISQLGDLTASAIKRKYDIKDYGKIFPGHGGVVDRFDSIIAVAPILLLLCYITSV